MPESKSRRPSGPEPSEAHGFFGRSDAENLRRAGKPTEETQGFFGRSDVENIKRQRSDVDTDEDRGTDER